MIRKRLRAVAGLVERFEFIAGANPGAAARFVDALEATLRRLEKMPKLGRAWGPPGTPLAEIRIRAVKGFENYVVYYRPIPDGIEWLAVRHVAQDDPDTTDFE